MMRSAEMGAKDESLANRVPRIPVRAEAPAAKGLSPAEADWMRDGDEGRGRDTRNTVARELAPWEQESISEQGERKVAELKADAEARFGGFFASVRSRMESIKNRVAQALFTTVGAGMEAGTIVKGTAQGAMEVAQAFNPANSLERNNRENVYRNIASDLAEEFAPVVQANVDLVKAVGRGIGKAGAAGVGLGAMGVGAAIEGGKQAAVAGRAAKESMSNYASDKAREIEAAITNAKISLDSAKGSARTAAENTLRTLEAQKVDLRIQAEQMAASAGVKAEELRDRATTYSGEKAREIEAAIINAKIAAEQAKGGAKAIAQDTLRRLEAQKLNLQIGAGELRANAVLTAGEMAKIVSGKYTETRESAEAKLRHIGTTIENAKILAKSATGATKEAAESAIRILEARRLDAEITAREALAEAQKRASAGMTSGQEKVAAAGRAGANAARATGRAAGTVAAVGAGAAILGVEAGYTLGKRGVAGTIAGAEAVGTKMREASTAGKVRYETAMRSLDERLQKASGFMEKMKLRLEIAQMKLRYGLNEAYKALITDEIRAENPEITANVESATKALEGVDAAAAAERVEATA